MINQLFGTVIAINNQVITIQPQGTGIGFGILVPQREMYILGKEAKLFTYLHWNQEQGPVLYGFQQELERRVFLLIISCSGIGPKIALATLETLTPEQFIQAIHEENVTTISTIPGIGKKKSEQIIVHLKHKIHDLIMTGVSLEGAAIKHWQQITEVLTSLNYSRSEINHAVQHLKQLHDIPEASFDLLLRRALSFLSKLR